MIEAVTQNDFSAEIERLAKRWISLADQSGISLDVASKMACEGIDERSPVSRLFKATIMIEKITRDMANPANLPQSEQGAK